MSQTTKQENFRSSIKLQQENPELEKAYSFIANQLHSLSDEYIAQNSFKNKEYYIRSSPLFIKSSSEKLVLPGDTDRAGLSFPVGFQRKDSPMLS